jgi:hypothetical protein
MSDFIPKSGGGKIGGLSRAAQKLQSAREKAELAKSGVNPKSDVTAGALKTKDSFANTKKTPFQRKSV